MNDETLTSYDDIYDLKLGDRFKEDTYDETYEVVGFRNSDILLVIAKDVETGEKSEWGYSDPAYSPCIYKV